MMNVAGYDALLLIFLTFSQVSTSYPTEVKCCISNNCSKTKNNMSYIGVKFDELTIFY
jgi:hypothetical protein